MISVNRPDNSNQDRIVRNTKLVTKLRAPRRMIRKHVEIQTERNHFDLSGPAHAKLFANLNALLLADNDQTIGNELRQQPLDREKQLRAACP